MTMQTQIEVPYRKNYDYGIGVDLATGSPMGKVVDGAISGVTDAHAATVLFEVSRIHTTSELETALGINVVAGGGSGCFSASGRMDFAKRSKIQASSLFMAITSTVELENLSIDEPALSSLAAGLVSRNDVFASRFGNMFVRGMGRGGVFVGVMRINTMGSEESQTIATELEGSYGMFSAAAKTKFDEVQKNHHSEILITVYHEGGPIDLAMDDLTDPNQLYTLLQRWLKSFQDDPAANAKPYSVTLAPIAIANGPIPPNAADIQHAQDVLVVCAKERSAILDGLNLMEFISQHPSRYDFVSPTTAASIAKAFAGYQADLDLVGKAASFAIDNMKEAKTPAEFARTHDQVYPQGEPPVPMPTMQKGMEELRVVRGEAVANRDPLAVMLRDSLADDPSRRGFNIAFAVDGAGTAPGPGKDRIRESLPDTERDGFDIAVSFFVERNRNLEFATKGAAIAKVVPPVAEARVREADAFFSLGFDIATGLFGDPALGGQGDTAPGPGKTRIRESLSDAGKRGFDASMKLHLGPPPLPRRT